MSNKARETYETIAAIARRAVEMADDLGVSYDHMTAVMDIDCVHKVTPLRLDELLAADDGNFGHDVFGIRRHLNRETKELENCFVPRFCRG